MDQLSALLWVKWRTFLSSMRSSNALVGQILLWGFGGLVFCVSLLFGAALFATLYAMVTARIPELAAMSVRDTLILVLGGLYMAWIMAALLPTRGGGAFEPGALLHYPMRPGRLFLFDLISEGARGVPLMLVPSLAGTCLALPVAAGRTLWAFPPLLVTVLLGTLTMKLFESLVALLNRRGRNRAESVVALTSILLVMAATLLGGASQQVKQSLLRGASGAVWELTPVALTEQMLVAAFQGDAGVYLKALGVLALYVPLVGTLAWTAWYRLATGAGATSRGRPRGAAVYRPWALPRGSEAFAALLEKEVKYLVRNPQVRVLLGIPLMILLFKWVPGRNAAMIERLGAKAADGPWLEAAEPSVLGGLPGVAMVAYLFLLYGALFNNLFGLDGHGVKSYLIAPVSRKVILMAKNLAITLVMVGQGAALLLVNQLMFDDLDADAVLTTVLAFLAGVAVVAGAGNLVSIYFPRRGEFGKRLEASRWGMLLTFLQVAAAMMPAAAAFLAAAATGAIWLKHAVLVLGVVVASCAYQAWWLPRAADALRRREPEVASIVTGGDE